jgi:hypothetical protein
VSASSQRPTVPRLTNSQTQISRSGWTRTRARHTFPARLLLQEARRASLSVIFVGVCESRLGESLQGRRTDLRSVRRSKEGTQHGRTSTHPFEDHSVA